MGLLSSVNPTVAGIVVFLLALQLLVLKSAGFSLNDTIQHKPQHVHPLKDTHVHAGIWGAPSSSVNWCEADYVYTRYVAEFWNTLSSLCMTIVGMVGRYTTMESIASQKKRGVYHPILSDININGLRRVKWTWFALEIVGWGSVLFHASLAWHTQALDEVPMVLTCCLILTTLTTSRFMRPGLHPTGEALFGATLPKKRASDGLRVDLLSKTALVYILVCAVLTTFFRGPLQFVLFQSLFGVVQWSSTMLIIWIFISRKTLLTYKEAVGDSAWQKRHEANIKRLFITGGSLYCGGVAIWLTDMHACDWMTNHGVPIPYYTSQDGFFIKYINPQGHAIWHLLVSLGFYHLNVIASYDRMIEAWTVYGKTKKDTKKDTKEPAEKETKKEQNGKADGKDKTEDDTEEIDGLRPDIEWWKGVMPVVRVRKGGIESKAQ